MVRHAVAAGGTSRPRELVARAGWVLPSAPTAARAGLSMFNVVQAQESSKCVLRGTRWPRRHMSCSRYAHSMNPCFTGRLVRPIRSSWRPGSCSFDELHPTLHRRRTGASAAAMQQLKKRERGGSCTLTAAGRVPMNTSSEDKATRALVPMSARRCGPSWHEIPGLRGSIFVRPENCWDFSKMISLRAQKTLLRPKTRIQFPAYYKYDFQRLYRPKKIL